jgi:hypothetical protein
MLSKPSRFNDSMRAAILAAMDMAPSRTIYAQAYFIYAAS